MGADGAYSNGALRWSFRDGLIQRRRGLCYTRPAYERHFILSFARPWQKTT